jgi:hypothetical protein
MLSFLSCETAPDPLCVCLEEGKQLAGGGRSAVAGGGGEADSTHGERIWSSFQKHKVERGLLLLIHILCSSPSSATVP